jgi:cytochrome c-type biogenesis protein
MTTPTLLLSLAAGVLAFLSPCIIPLLPSYISFIGGVTTGETEGSGPARWLVFTRTLFFVAGFTIVFVGLGVILSGTGLLLGGGMRWINLAAGAVIVLLGVNFIFDFWKMLNIERRFQLRKPNGIAGAVLLGMAFGAGWTPCVGPMLAAILVLAGTSGSVAIGVLYLIAFSLGLGIPFLLASLFFSSLPELTRRMRDHARSIRLVSGVLLIAIGVLVGLGRLQQLPASLFRIGAAASRWSSTNPSSRYIVGGSILLLASLPVIVSLIRSSYTNTARPWSPAKIVLVTIGVGLAVLNVAGVIDLVSALARWFFFTGL